MHFGNYITLPKCGKRERHRQAGNQTETNIKTDRRTEGQIDRQTDRAGETIKPEEFPKVRYLTIHRIYIKLAAPSRADNDPSAINLTLPFIYYVQGIVSTSCGSGLREHNEFPTSLGSKTCCLRENSVKPIPAERSKIPWSCSSNTTM